MCSWAALSGLCERTQQDGGDGGGDGGGDADGDGGGSSAATRMSRPSRDHIRKKQAAATGAAARSKAGRSGRDAGSNWRAGWAKPPRPCGVGGRPTEAPRYSTTGAGVFKGPERIQIASLSSLAYER